MKNLALLTLLLFVAACNTTVRGKSPDVTVKGDGYEVEVDGDSSKGDFCPPGHAKKGWC